MHTYNLLTERADRSTIVPDQLPLLDAFLADQKALQESSSRRYRATRRSAAAEKSREKIDDHFRLLQACDNLSLLSCVDYQKPATLLHPLRLKDGGVEPIVVESLGERYFCLTPYPFDLSPVEVAFPARHVEGRTFASAEALQEQFADADVTMLTVTVTA